MPRVYLSASELNARLAETRNQRFRKRTQDQIEGINLREADPAYQQKRKEALLKSLDETWHSNVTKSAVVRSKHPAWLKNTREKNKRMYKSSSWQQNLKKGIERRTQDPVWKKKNADKNTQTLGCPCRVQPLGKPWKTFDSFGKAQDFYKWSSLANAPKQMFPEDGSVRIGRHGPRKGWQTQRITK
jgi:hypothetical protein